MRGEILEGCHANRHRAGQIILRLIMEEHELWFDSIGFDDTAERREQFRRIIEGLDHGPKD